MLTAADGLRHKECYDDELELAPVRLLGGFVLVDTHLGCVGCSFCLNRRYPVLRGLLERKTHLDYSAIGVTPERIASWLAGISSVVEAGVPVRFGHVTDLAFEERDACRVVEMLPPDHPVLMNTRFPIGEATRHLLRRHRNVLLHVTVTPAGLDPENKADSNRTLESLRGLPPDQVFVMIGPLVAGAGPAARELLARLPAASRIGFKEVDIAAIPGCEALAPMPRTEVEALIARAGELGHRWLPFYGCQVRANLGRPCFFSRAAARAPQVCARCPNQPICASVRLPAAEQVREAAARIGLTAGEVRIAESRVELEIAEPASRADEVFLSEKLTAEVRLSTVARAERRETIRLSEAIFERWQRVGFYPVEELRRLGRQMARLIRSA